MPRVTRKKTQEAREESRDVDGEDAAMFADILQTTAPAKPRKSNPKRNLTDLNFEEIIKKPKKEIKPNAAENIDIDAMMRETEGAPVSNKENEFIKKEKKPRKKIVAKTKAKSTRSKKVVKEEVPIENSAIDEFMEDSDDEISKKDVKPKKSKLTKKGKYLMEDKSDWSDDSDTEKPKKKSKTKKTDPNTEVLDEDLRIVEGKYLDDGTLQIQVTEKQKEEKFGKNGKLCWQENPHNIPRISESNRLWHKNRLEAEIRSMVNRSKTDTAQVTHKFHLLVNIWVGLEWDKLCDCKLIHAKLISMMDLEFSVKSVKELKSFLIRYNQMFSYPTSAKDTGFPSPVGGLLLLDQALATPENKNDKVDWFTKDKSRFPNFVRNGALVSAFRALGVITRLVLNVEVFPHKPKSEKQLDEILKKNSEREKDLKKKSDSVTLNSWTEVYIGKKWIPIAIQKNKFAVFETENLEKYLKFPVSYCLAFDGGVRDVTARYASEWLTETKKLRFKYTEKNWREEGANWWKDTTEIWQSRNYQLEKTENKVLSTMLKDQGIPKTMAKIKGHPLYVIKRHILKYEALYPNDVEPVGSMVIKSKGLTTTEEVFPRFALKSLHTRNTWMQKAQVVKEAEIPYKMVSSWLQNRKAKCAPDAKNSALFGEWQTKPYEPEIAKNGLVPRNNFGNVDLYKESMLPIGCVWIKDILEPAIFSRTCKKLDIDCVKAVTGFDGKKGYPVTEGYVLCKEFEETARAAYAAAASESIKKNAEKIRVRARNNWRHLVKVYFISKKLNKVFGKKAPDPQLAKILRTAESKKWGVEESLLSPKTENTSNASKSKYFKKTSSSRPQVKVIPDSVQESSAEESDEIEEEMSSEDSEIERKQVKKMKKSKIMLPTRKSSRAKATASKYAMSTDSSDFSAESEDDWK